MLDSATCKNERVQIIRGFSRLLQNAKQVILSDADLRECTIHFVKVAMTGFYQDVLSEELLERIAKYREMYPMSNNYGSIPPVRTDFNRIVHQEIINNYVHTGRIAHSYSKKEELITEAFAQVSQGNKIMLHTSGQNESSKLGTTNLEIQFNNRFPDLKVLRIDSETVRQKGHPAYGCMENINEAIKDYDVVIASQTIETGISIDLVNHFSSVFLISNGIQTVDGVAQALERVRDDVPRYIYAAASSANNAIASGETNADDLYMSQSYKTYTIVGALKQLGVLISNQIGQKRQFIENNNFSILWCQMAAHHNVGYNWHRETLHKKLRATGYKVIEMKDAVVDDVLQDNLEASVEQSKQQRIERLLETETIARTEFQKLTADKNVLLTQEEKDRVIRYVIELALGSYDAQHINLYLETNIAHELRLRHVLGAGRKFMEIKEKLRGRDKVMFSIDRNKQSSLVDVLALESIGVLDWLELDTINIKIANKLLQDLGTPGKKVITKALGIKWRARTNSTTVVGKILSCLGYELKKGKRKMFNGTQLNTYTIVDKYDDVAENILAHMLKRDEEVHNEIKKKIKSPELLNESTEEDREQSRELLVKTYGRSKADQNGDRIIWGSLGTIEDRLSKLA